MAKKRQGKTFFPIKIPLNTLSGGVGRQAPTKRLPSEVEDMNNMFCTTERSIDKRNGFAPLDGLGLDLGIDLSEGKQLWFNWFFVGDEQRYLFVIDFAASIDDQLFWVFKIDTESGTIISQDVDMDIENVIHFYLTFGDADSLRAVSVGSSLLVLNTVVMAGFTSSGEDDFMMYHGGNPSAVIDTKGRKIDYQTTITVDPEGAAEVWNTESNYVWGQKAIDTNDPKADEVYKYGIWKVKDNLTAAQLPGPTTPDYWVDVEGNAIAATANITITNPSVLGDQDSFTLYDTVGTAHVFTIDVTSDLTDNNRVGVKSAKAAGSDAAADALGAIQFNAAINAGTCSDTITSAISPADAAVLILTQDVIGSEGNRENITLPFASSGSVTDFTGGVGAIDPEANYPSNRTDRWERVTETTITQDPADGSDIVVVEDKYTEFISVEDYTYPDPDKPYLGQSISKFSELRFPPDDNDVDASNSGEQIPPITSQALQALYPEIGNVYGLGKIYYLSEAYLGSNPGWYRVISSTDKPYLQNIRTPDEMSVIDQKRMPMQIFLDVENNRWSIRMVDWEPRTSGTKKTNPGPSFFQDKDGKAQQKQIKAIAFYRDRLFLASDDTLISSRLGKFDDLFIGDPSNITVSDPIDLSVSSNIYTPITFLQPFRDFMFLGTSGDTQYELIGSENQISPLTAEIAPTSFFPMTTDIEPLLMNNNLFFFSKKRLFIYFGTGSNTINQQAFELSRHVPNYLPSRFWSATVSSAHNTIFVVEGETPGNKIFCYRNQIANEQIVQNAFFTFTVGGKIHSIKAIEDDLYVIVEEHNTLQIQKISLIPDSEDIPRLDNKRGTPLASSYDSSTDITTFYFNDYPLQNEDQIFVTQPTELQGTVIDITRGESGLTATASGNFNGAASGWVGNKFLATVTLSDIFVRDDENNVIPGTLNLRYGITRHHKTGNYTLGVTRKQRTQKTYVFEPNVLDDRTVEADGNINELNGVFKFPLMGFTDDLDITISSSFPHPMNITNIELTGKFKRVPHFLTT
jgi:hypothetical protein